MGELFDHGCDAWAAVFIATTFYNTFGRTESYTEEEASEYKINGNSGYSISELRMYGVMSSVFFTFHLSHWEKYNTSVMYLPVSVIPNLSFIVFGCFHIFFIIVVGV